MSLKHRVTAPEGKPLISDLTALLIGIVTWSTRTAEKEITLCTDTIDTTYNIQYRCGVMSGAPLEMYKNSLENPRDGIL